MTLLSKVVGIANKVTKSLKFQALVSYDKCTGVSTDGYGTLLYENGPVLLSAIVEMKQEQVTTLTGILAISRASILFIDTPALIAATGGVPIDSNDTITLPDGTSGPILNVAGFVDAGAIYPVTTQVYLG